MFMMTMMMLLRNITLEFGHITEAKICFNFGAHGFLAEILLNCMSFLNLQMSLTTVTEMFSSLCSKMRL